MSFINKFYILPIKNKETLIRTTIELIRDKCIPYESLFGELKLWSFIGEHPNIEKKVVSIEESIKSLVEGSFDSLKFTFNRGIGFDIDFGVWETKYRKTIDESGKTLFNIDLNVWKTSEIKKISIFANDCSFTSFWYDEPEGLTDAKEFIIMIIDICKNLYNLVHPFYGCGNNLDYIEVKTEYEDAKQDKIKAIYWVNFFGPKLVEKYGRERLLSAPSWKTEGLSDGGIMLVRSPNPFTIDEPYIKAEVIEEYLGIKG